MSRQKQRAPAPSRAVENFHQGYGLAQEHPLFGPLVQRATVSRSEEGLYPREGWARVEANGTIHVHPTRVAEPEEWLYVLAHCLLHLGFGHFQHRFQQREWEMACECVVWQFLSTLKLGMPPFPLRNLPELGGPELPARTEETLFRYFCDEGLAADLPSYGVTGTSFTDMIESAAKPPRTSYGAAQGTWDQIFGHALVQAVSSAIGVAGGAEPVDGRQGKRSTPAQRARDWFVSSYPLLGALAASFTLIEEPAICGRLQISIAAVSDYGKELYVNPAVGLSEAESRFVMAHELLHVALRHSMRCRGRDPYLWNVACDFVINEWLAEMCIGSLPRVGLLLDDSLKGLSAEAVYDRIVTDLRRFRRLGTFRGVGLGDILDAPSASWWATHAGVDLDAFYRNCLAQGLLCHDEQRRGLLPAALIEEIRALSQPPIPWDVELARWFDDCFPPLEKVRSYARPSRRQSSTPDIPRPRYVPPPLSMDGRTFGVVLDTSGSMDRLLLGDCLGAIASYSESREVPAARVVFCDAFAYDAGYMRPDDIAGRVKVRGRGGTVLQPGIDLLERGADFPKSGPILIVTDGFCDRFEVRREHAILLPEGRALPFAPMGKVFRIRRP
jgi:predicted metal-dependent peptidase